MTGRNRPARLNRSLLATLGVALLAGGGVLVAAQTGRLSVVDRAATLVPGTALPPTWVFYVTAAGAVLVALLALRWLIAQLTHAPKTETWRLERDPDRGRTELTTSTAVAPFTTELATYPGVHAAHAALSGGAAEPSLTVVISVEQQGDLNEIRKRLDTHGLPRLRQALDLTTLPVSIEFRFSTRTGSRVR